MTLIDPGKRVERRLAKRGKRGRKTSMEERKFWEKKKGGVSVGVSGRKNE